MFLIFKRTILVADALIFCFKFNLITMIEKKHEYKIARLALNLCTGYVSDSPWRNVLLTLKIYLREKMLKIIIIKFK